MSKKNDFRYLAFGTVAYGVLAFTGVAYAQETDAENDEPVVIAEEEEDDSDSVQQKVVVTGSLLRRDEYSSASPIQVITAETATVEGLIDAADIIQSQSVASGSTQINGNFGGFVVEGGTGVNTISLRGLGAQRTLVVFNGRRIGPSGVQGQVGAVDLNVIPTAAIQRVEILKDGASSIYGSDAVAGVVNVITRRSLDKPELNFSANVPYESGGEQFSVDGAYGFNFDNGSAVISAAYQKLEDLSIGDRDYFSCPQDYLFTEDGGTRTDLVDPTTGQFKCYNALAGVYDVSGIFGTSPADAFRDNVRFIYDPMLGTFRPRDGDVGGPASNLGLAETTSNLAKEQSTDVIPETERASIFATLDYNLGFAEFFGDALYTNRKTEQTDFRQLFPFVNAGDPFEPAAVDEYQVAGLPASLTQARPISLIPFDTSVDIDYFSATAGLRGDFGASGFLSDWNWEVAAVYSKSDADYNRDTVPVNRVNDRSDPRTDLVQTRNADGSVSCTYTEYSEVNGELQATPNQSCPAINYFTRDFVYGNFTAAEADFLFEVDSGTTTYEQTTVTGVVTGSLFSLPAGDVGLALGAEFRDYELTDTPGFYSRNNLQWGLSSAGITSGSDQVMEAFGELEIPILAGLPFAEELTLNVSGRVFEYDSYGSDSVYKAGLNYQVTPSVRLRSTFGTSYRTPALYELFLANQTSFLGQTAIDPCDFAEGGPNNPNIRANCLAEVPADYTPVGSSALITTGGGAGVLDAETSEAFTVGTIFTPTWANLSVAVDYFEIEVNDQIAQLGAGSIVSGCYASDTFPNDPLCGLFQRDLDPDSPRYLQITDVNDSYVNINSQTSRGLDLTARYEHEFDFGDIIYDIQGTWTFEDAVVLFGGTDFEIDEFNGTIGDPDFTANSRLQFVSGDITLNYFTDFVSRTSNTEDIGGSVFGGEFYKAYTEPYFLHGISAQYRADDWRLTLGMNNIFDEGPPYVSVGTATRRGNAPLVGTQYDYRGRSAFVRVQKQF